ncbi:hypothetical protein CEXT_89051 [Caerostris extrusa]|uniref:Uncharacterized protein n=1 Tax=Caerostris extrusa TaxID=172846 RepID=A0AAV4SY51_CAEEX|nr:hypothetical protein CEXT_89051 [Caerostris extrusa]
MNIWYTFQTTNCTQYRIQCVKAYGNKYLGLIGDNCTQVLHAEFLGTGSKNEALRKKKKKRRGVGGWSCMRRKKRKNLGRLQRDGGRGGGKGGGGKLPISLRAGLNLIRGRLK